MSIVNRANEFMNFSKNNANVSFMWDNVPRILENLEKADKNNCLRQFLLNKEPYRSAFTFFVFHEKQQAARGKDQVAIVLALNIYGADKPGFAAKLNQTLKTLANGTSKEAQSVIVLLATQLQLQELEISLIDFVDYELLELVNKKVKKLKGPRIALMLLFLFGGAIGMPGFTMLGLFPLTFAAIGLFIYGFIKLFYWIGMPVFGPAVFDKAVRPVGEYWEHGETVSFDSNPTPQER